MGGVKELEEMVEEEGEAVVASGPVVVLAMAVALDMKVVVEGAMEVEVGTILTIVQATTMVLRWILLVVFAIGVGCGGSVGEVVAMLVCLWWWW